MCNPDTTFISLRYDEPDFWIRLFSNSHKKTSGNDTLEVEDANNELEALRTLRWGRNITNLGIYIKHIYLRFSGLKGSTAGRVEKHDAEDYAFNLENEYHLNDQLILTLGGRGEYYSHLDFIGLGRGSIIYKPSKSQSFRFTIASGYYIPSLFEQAVRGDVYSLLLGNSSLKEEEITSYELAYYGWLTDRIKLSTSLFYNDYRDFINNESGVLMQNIADAYQYGGELSFDLLLTDWLSLLANYTYQNIHREDFGGLEVDPKNKFNFGLKAKFAKWSANLVFHYVDKYYEIYQTANPVYGRLTTGPEKKGSYTTADARIAYSPASNLELAIAAYNLFKDKHYESNSGGGATSDKLGRRITASVSYKF
jgi:outer membrane receptor protein involved in Fe transport